MMFATPDSIAAQVTKAYRRQFLKRWVDGDAEDFFPYLVQRIGKLTDKRDVDGTVRAVNELRQHSRERTGWGYQIEEEMVGSRTFGNTMIPQRIVVPSQEDFLRLAKSVAHYRATERAVATIRKHFPTLEPWLRKHIYSLADATTELDGLITVAEYFVQNPWPDRYARQLPCAVDTKFIERNQAVLGQWLDMLLPSTAIDTNEKSFARRFGLRDKESFVMIRLLDDVFRRELGWPFNELSVPLRAIQESDFTDVTVFIVENRLNLLALPAFHRGVAIRGDGFAANRLTRINWLRQNRVIYWGDIDVEGLEILSLMRRSLPHLESLLMDAGTLSACQDLTSNGNRSDREPPSHLHREELAAYEECRSNNVRLEQERIPQAFVAEALKRLRVDAERA